MPIDIRSEDANRLAERLACKTKLTETAVVSRAVPLRERLRPFQREIRSWPATGLEADKAFPRRSLGRHVTVIDASTLAVMRAGEPEADAFAAGEFPV